jgi:hypothetical protein
MYGFLWGCCWVVAARVLSAAAAAAAAAQRRSTAAATAAVVHSMHCASDQQRVGVVEVCMRGEAGREGNRI